jgi:hypothetical protein
MPINTDDEFYSNILAFQLKDFLQIWLSAKLKGTNKSIYIYSNNIPTDATNDNTFKYFIAYVEIDCDLLFPVSTDVIDYLLAIPKFMNSTVNKVQDITSIRYTAEVASCYMDDTDSSEILDEYNKHFYLITSISEEGFRYDFPKTILTLHHSCPLIKLKNEEYGITRYPHSIYIKELNASLDKKNVLITSDHEEVLLCVDTFKGVLNKATIDTEVLEPKLSCKVETDSSVAVLSLVCSCISISFSFVTVIVFFSFKELQTQPGINNVILCFALIVAQSLFQFGSGQSCNVSKAVCQGIGICVHFSWLFVIFWMNSCCIHMFRVFRLSRIRIVQFNKLKTTFMYIQYSFTASLAGILTTIIVSLSMTNGREIGYGGSMCYIQKGEMVAYLFTLPVGLVIMINIILFSVVVIQMQNSRMSLDQDRNFLHIYAKLSTLTGFTWIFGFLSFFLNVNLFDYIFIVLNASQGICLFFAFVANKRTLNFLLRTKASQNATTLST